jgi:hypothetical protein
MTRQVLAALADLVPPGPPPFVDVASGPEPFVFFGKRIDPGPLFRPPSPSGQVLGLSLDEVVPLSRQPSKATAVARLDAIDNLNRTLRVLRAGWLFLVGEVDESSGEPKRVCMPLASIPVRVRSGNTASAEVEPVAMQSHGVRQSYGRFVKDPHLVPIGEPEICSLVTDPLQRRNLTAALPVAQGAIDEWTPANPLAPATAAWVKAVASAAGIDPPGRAVVDKDPVDLQTDHLTVVGGWGLYISRDAYEPDLRTVLRLWSAQPGIGRSAFARVYGSSTTPQPPTSRPARTDSDDGRLWSPLPLNSTQAEVVRHTRLAPITVVSGAPGCGKSHTVVALALDNLARGSSVLVATRTAAATAAVGELFRQAPGPDPVVFGDDQARFSLADRIEAALGTRLSEEQLQQIELDAVAAQHEVQRLERLIRAALDLEGDAAAGSDPNLIGSLLSQCPGAFAAEAELGRAADLAQELRGGGVVARLRARRAEAELRHLVDASASTSLDDTIAAVEVAVARRGAIELEQRGGTTLAALFDELARADERTHAVLATLVGARSTLRRDHDPKTRYSVGALATALRADRTQRRARIARVAADRLLDGLGLWIGTLDDIEDILPPTAAMFDLVIIDEASHATQHQAAPALLRDRRAVVVGDPKQLRHTTAATDVDIAVTTAAHGVDHLAAVLDVGTNSAFDAAQSAAPTIWLDEHYRSVPHLIGFSRSRIYADRFALATQHPSTDSLDAIDVVAVDGRDRDGCNTEEVDAVRSLVRHALSSGLDDIAVIAPFRPQADALQAMLHDELAHHELTAGAVTVGTIEDFQGAQHDVGILSLTIDADSPPRRRNALDDATILNVAITRPKQMMVVVTSLDDHTAPPLLGDYLRWSHTPPGPPALEPETDAWILELAAELAAAGVHARVGYPVGRWTVDICAGDEDRAAALECRPHPNGSWDHIERRRALHRAGWRVLDAYPTRWDRDPVRAAIDLATQLRTES